MRSNLLINEILSKIEFKIQPDKNIRKQYIYRIKKRIYKFLNNEKNFINSNTIFRNIDKEEKEAINKLALKHDAIIDNVTINNILIHLNKRSKKPTVL